MNRDFNIKENYSKTILCLYETSGVFSRLYHNLGYDIVQVDIQNEPFKKERWEVINSDCRLIQNLKGKEIVGIISHPPCTIFAGSGNRWRKNESVLPSTNNFHDNLLDQKIQDGLSMVDVVFRLVVIHRPTFWFIENPIGKLSKYLGKHNFSFNPFEFAMYLQSPQNHLPWINFSNKIFKDFVKNPGSEAYTKRTLLWGDFKKPVKETSLLNSQNSLVIMPEFVSMKGGKRMSKVHYDSLNLEKSERANVRSETAKGFAIAFVKANMP